ncbi:hypothetical protein EU803_00555 [Loktanella sp. IMCC34160]|uniref:hypothetical protein n=1 Tax=Loktanella sp. IMCC34160 TaxID=2510646 RepID=UPI0010DB08BB|nr:hypothetical protein [Loktanella sp. IMCC34160]RYG92630.1 hypothetical protein EU803_00555 [Loktanella sp. IMCC34160]
MMQTQPQQIANTPEMAVDLRYPAMEADYGDIRLTLTWYIPDGQPCMVLTPLLQRHKSAFVPPIILLTNAWRWDEKIGDTRWAYDAAGIFTEALGFTRSIAMTHRILSIIRDNLGELLALPNMTHTESHAVVAELTVTNRSTGKTRQIEVSRHV